MKQTTMKGAGIATLALIAAFASAQSVQVTVNGDPVQFNAAQPQMMDGRVLVPLRGVFEDMGATVTWDPASRTVMADGNNHHIRLQIGSMDANVDGNVVALDVPPQIIQASTMVPLRFLSESLGATVDWQPQNDLVAITTMGSAAQRFTPPPPPPPVTQAPPPPPRTIIIREKPAKQPPPPAPPFIVTRDTVIPLTLNRDISSNDSKPGDHFTAMVRGDGGTYLNFPRGTEVEGYVRTAHPASGSHGGVLDIRFTDIKFPNGNTYKINGIVRKLDDPNIIRTNDGRYVAKSGSDNNVGRDAAIGAGAGLVIGSLSGKAVGGAVLGGALGAIVGALDHHLAHNVNFDRGTRFGLILDRDLRVDRADLRD